MLNAGDAPFTIERGARIAQAVLAPVVRGRWHEVDTLEATARTKAASAVPATEPSGGRPCEVYPLADRLDRAALAGAAAALEQDADLAALAHHPLLQLDQFLVQPGEFARIGLAAPPSPSRSS